VVKNAQCVSTPRQKLNNDIITHTDFSRGGSVFTAICRCVCLFFRMISHKPLQLYDHQTRHGKMLHDESWKPIYFVVKRSKVKDQGHESQKQCRLGRCTVLVSSIVNS